MRNLADGRAEAVAELLKAIEKGPPVARVDEVDAGNEQPTGEFTRFEQRR